MKIKNKSDLVAYDPIKEMTDENFIGKEILECLRNNENRKFLSQHYTIA